MTDHTRIDALSPGTFSLDGEEIDFGPGESILEAATRTGHYIPHLCWHPDFGAKGSCRLCTVKINGRIGAACTVQAASGQEVFSNTEELNAQRKTLLQMIFIEGESFLPIL
jgi:[NiFe] hydrogenase diaphorase moiety small subunit